MILEVTGGITLIDDEDLEFLEQFSWHLDDNGYVKTTMFNSEKKTYVTLRMHQLLMGRKEGLWIDHKNNMRNDNRKSNLCHVTPKGNYDNSLIARHHAMNKFRAEKGLEKLPYVKQPFMLTLDTYTQVV